MNPATPYAPETAAAQSVSIADLFLAQSAELELQSALRLSRMATSLARLRTQCEAALSLDAPEPVATEPVAAEPAAAEPVAAEPAAAEPAAAEPVAAEPATAATGSRLHRVWHRLAGSTPVTPVTVARYHGCRDGWRVVGVRADRGQAERLLSLAQRINPNATLKLR